MKHRIKVRELAPGMRLLPMALVVRAIPCPKHLGSYVVFAAEFKPAQGRVVLTHMHVHGSEYIDIEIGEDEIEYH